MLPKLIITPDAKYRQPHSFSVSFSVVLWKNDVYFGLLYFKNDDEKLASI